MALGVWAVVSIWLAIAAVLDWKTRTVPNVLTLFPMEIAFAFRIWWGYWDIAEIVLIVGYIWLWGRGAIGGADAKIGLALTFVSPTWGYAALVGLVALGLVWKVKRWRGHVPAVVGMAIGVFLLTFPTVLHIIKLSAQGVVCLSKARPL